MDSGRSEREGPTRCVCVCVWRGGLPSLAQAVTSACSVSLSHFTPTLPDNLCNVELKSHLLEASGSQHRALALNSLCSNSSSVPDRAAVNMLLSFSEPQFPDLLKKKKIIREGDMYFTVLKIK